VADGHVRIEADESLRRRRPAVVFRAPLVLPHYLVLAVWTLLVVPLVAILLVLSAWPAAITDRSFAAPFPNGGWTSYGQRGVP